MICSPSLLFFTRTKFPENNQYRWRNALCRDKLSVGLYLPSPHPKQRIRRNVQVLVRGEYHFDCEVALAAFLKTNQPTTKKLDHAPAHRAF